MVMLVSVIAVAIASDPNSKVLGMVSYAWAGFGAAFGPVILLSLFWPRMTRNGALAGIITGAVTVLVWKQANWLGLYEIVPGFMLGGISVIVFSLMDSTPSAEMQQRFQAVEKEIRQISH